MTNWVSKNLSKVDGSACLISGILLALCYPPFNISILIWIALIPFLFRIRPHAPAINFVLGLITGIVFYLLHLHWLYHVTTAGMLGLVIFLSVIYGLQAIAAGKLLNYPFFPITIALLWGVVEYLRSLTFLSFAWGYLGHSLYQWNTLQPYAYYLGVPGLSFFIATVNVSLTALITYWIKEVRGISFSNWKTQKPLIDHAIFIITTLLIITASMVQYLSPQKQSSSASTIPFRISLIQGGLEQGEKESSRSEDTVKRYLKLSTQALSSQPDLIIWPESTITAPLNYEPELVTRLLNFVTENDVELLVGTIHGRYMREEGWDFWNRAELISPHQHTVTEEFEIRLEPAQHYEKIHLVPYGEWIPMGDYWPFYHIETLIEEAGAGLFQRGQNLTIFKTRKGVTFAVAICFESTLAGQLSRAYRKGADFLVNISNDAWFKRSAGLEQHFVQATFRAAENRCYLVRVANSGINGVVGPTGKVLIKSPPSPTGHITYELQISRPD